MFLIHDIHVCDLRIEMNFQFMIPAVLSATEVVAREARGRPEKFEPEQGLEP